MKVIISVTGAEGTIELIPETIVDRDLLNAVVNTNQEAKIKKNGTTKMVFVVPELAIGRVAQVSDREHSE